MGRRGFVGVFLAMTVLTGHASAHHSAAMFDATKSVTLRGTVKQFRWTNPHAWLYVTVDAADGAAEEWSIEMTSPNLLKRAGWLPSTIKFGDKITVVGAPLRDGSRGAQFRSATMGDGRVLSYSGITTAAASKVAAPR